MANEPAAADVITEGWCPNCKLALVWQSITNEERHTDCGHQVVWIDTQTEAGGSSAARLTATYRGPDGQPVERDEYASLLVARMEEYVGQRPVPVGRSAVAMAAGLLDELAGIYPDEPLGRMAAGTAAGMREFLKL